MEVCRHLKRFFFTWFSKAKRAVLSIFFFFLSLIFNLPIVNPDLSSETEILAKPVEFKHSFKSPALRVVDQVLSHMDSPNYGLMDFSNLGKIVHAAHMQDWWSEASRAYSELQDSETNVDDSLCACIRDVDNNGIAEAMRTIAHRIGNEHSKLTETERKDKFCYNTPFGLPIYKKFTLYKNFSFSKGNTTPEFCTESHEESPELPELTNTEAWKEWRAMLHADDSEMREYGKQLALYMHCILQ
jgi:hypothetical protein